MTFRERILRRIAAVACDHAWIVVAGFVLVTALSVTVIAFRGRVTTDLTDILPRDSKEAALYVEVAEHFAADVLIVCVEGTSPVTKQQIDAGLAAIDTLAGARPDEAADASAVANLMRGGARSREAKREALEAARRLGFHGNGQAVEELDSIVDRMAGGVNDPSEVDDLKALLGRLPSDAGAAGRAKELFARVAERRPGGPAYVDAAKPYVEALARRLAGLERALPGGGTEPFVKAVEYKFGEKTRRFVREFAEKRGYLYLGEEDRELLASKITSDAIAAQMAENRRRLEAMGSDYFEQRIVPDPLNLYEAFKRRGGSGGQFVPRVGESYLVSPDGTMLLMLVQATRPVKDMDFDREFVAAAERAAAETWDALSSDDPSARAALRERLAPEGVEVPDDPAAWKALRKAVTVSFTGGYAIAAVENRVLKSDLFWCFSTSLVFVLAIFALGFRRLGALFYIGMPLVASVVWTLAAAFVLFGHISMMSGGFAAILVGLSVDYAIHIYNCYVAERARGGDPRASVGAALAAAGSGIFFGALTTSVAFFGVTLTRFVGLREFGLLAAIGVILGMAAMFLVLPALLFLRGRMGSESRKVTDIHGFRLDAVARAVGRRPGLVFGAAAALALAAGVFVYVTMTVYFFDSDLKTLRPRSATLDQVERIQQKFGTGLAGIVALSRGATEDEALEQAAEVLQRARRLEDGVSVAAAAWPGGEPSAGRPFIRVDGSRARVRRAEIALAAGAAAPEGLAPTAEIVTRPDGMRSVVYRFESARDLADWTFDGAHAFYRGSADLACEDGRGTVMRWRHEVAAPAEFTFSVRYLGTPAAVEMGLGERAAARATVSGKARPGEPWPPTPGDQVRLTLLARAEGPNGGGALELVAGRDTIESVDSVARLVPPREQQEASARFMASIDIDRVAADIDASARAAGLNPAAFEGFVERFRGMVERAREPEYLTLGELAASEFGAVLSKYYARIPGEAGGREHAVASYLYPEQGEMPREWYARVDAALGGAGEVASGRLVSLAMRDIVHQDFPGLMAFVVTGVALSLLLSFKSVRWSLVALLPVFASFALMLATLLVTGHRLNLMNFLAFPILVGIGIDYGIHVVHRFLQGARVSEIITETGRAFVLTTLTTMAGFGSLVLSRFRGLSSFGFVTILGMLFVLLTSLVALPAMLALVERRKADRSKRVPEREEGPTCPEGAER